MKSAEVFEIQKIAEKLLILCAQARIENEEKDKQIEKDRKQFKVFLNNKTEKE